MSEIVFQGGKSTALCFVLYGTYIVYRKKNHEHTTQFKEKSPVSVSLEALQIQCAFKNVWMIKLVQVQCQNESRNFLCAPMSGMSSWVSWESVQLTVHLVVLNSDKEEKEKKWKKTCGRATEDDLSHRKTCNRFIVYEPDRHEVTETGWWNYILIV